MSRQTKEAPSSSRASPFQQHLYANRYLLGGLVMLVVLSNIPFGQYVLYPFELFSTWIHEMCHGLAALAVGGEFQELRLFTDTSGQARSHYVDTRLNLIAVASAGYLGTSCFGALLLLLQRPTRLSRSLAAASMCAIGALAFLQVRPASGVVMFLFLIVSIGLLAFAFPPREVGRFGVFATGCAMLLSLIYAQTIFTIATLLALGGLLVLLGIQGKPVVANFLFSMLAATCGLNAVTSINSLFSASLVVNGKSVDHSDAHAVASYLFGSHKIWAALWLAFSVFVLGWALWHSILSPTVHETSTSDSYSPSNGIHSNKA